MFYCDACAKKYDYPETLFKSVGRCECCGEQAVCNEMRSTLLPPPKDIFSRFAGTSLFPDFPKKKSKKKK